MIGFYYHRLFAEHLLGYGHIERPARVLAIIEKIKASPVAASITFVDAIPAERYWLERVHDPNYIDDILNLKIEDAFVLDWGDTIATPATPQAALYAAGCSVQAARDVLSGKFSAGFCAVRPPGHHAEPARAMGFCIFNNIAIAAADLIDAGGLERVAIIDWDIHHGNGTERMFLEDDKVLYISLHQYPHFPGTGQETVYGTGKGSGYNLNIPLGSGAGDDLLLDAFHHQVIPTLDDYKPQFILISAGFDGHKADPMSSTNLTTAVYGEITRLTKECADRHCGGKIVSILEGGYNLSALAESVELHLMELAK
jgi:acetoin utilization deacetylase AcuC-like enzyme